MMRALCAKMAHPTTDDGRRAGHTLLELLVASTLFGLLSWVSMTAWGPMNQSILALRDRAQDSAELRIAVEYLLQDLGGAESALPDDEGRLHIRRERRVAALAGVESAEDPGVLYWLDGDGLIRREVAADSTIIVANRIALFDVQLTAEGGTRLRLDAIGGDAEAVSILYTY